VHQQLFPIIQNAKIITLPSRIDNLPNACIESMSLGKIVIGSRGASFDQLIEDGINGFLCEIKQPKTILKKIIEALELSDEQKKLISTKAKERIEKLSPEIVTKQLVEFYQSAIDCHKKNFKNK
jgi:glycosyltransferase involved in cell wall biosynthesis